MLNRMPVMSPSWQLERADIAQPTLICLGFEYGFRKSFRSFILEKSKFKLLTFWNQNNVFVKQ